MAKTATPKIRSVEQSWQVPAPTQTALSASVNVLKPTRLTVASAEELEAATRLTEEAAALSGSAVDKFFDEDE